MKWKLHTPEQIVTKLCEADAMLATGGAIDQIVRQLGISEATYYNSSGRRSLIDCGEENRTENKADNAATSLIVVGTQFGIRSNNASSLFKLIIYAI